MKYDITKPTTPAMPNLGKGTECFKLLLSQASSDMHAPLLPMLFPVLGTKISQVEFQYPSGQWFVTDNDCLWDMGKRSLISAWKAGCIMWALNGQVFTRSMADVVEWLVYHDMCSKYQVLGDMLKEGDTSTAEAQKATPANMLDDIKGDSFTELQLEALRESIGKSKDGTKCQLRVWVHRGLITFNAQTGLYTKTEAYLNRTR